VLVGRKEKLRVIVYYLIGRFQDISGYLISADLLYQLEEALNSISDEEADAYLKKIKDCIEELRVLLNQA
jgi:hypothetical protein